MKRSNYYEHYLFRIRLEKPPSDTCETCNRISRLCGDARPHNASWDCAANSSSDRTYSDSDSKAYTKQRILRSELQPVP